MLHEILFAMLGKLGNVILEVDGKFIVNPSLDFISSSEAELIQKLTTLGYHYRTLINIVKQDRNAFNTRVLSLNYDNQEETFDLGALGNSAYVRAVCDGVQEMLTRYEGLILEVEKDYLKEKVFTFSSMAVKFSEYYSLFSEAVLIFERIEDDCLRGGQLLDFLYQNSLNGNSDIKKMYSRLLENCFAVLYNQTMLWILHGKLFDKFDEFFIYRLARKKKEGAEGGGKQGAVGALNKGRKTRFGGGGGRRADDREEDDTLIGDWDGVFSMRYSLLPKFVIPQKTAEKILFIGKSVRVLLATESFNSNIFSIQIIEVVKEAAKFDFLNFQVAIEKIRAHIASKFLKLFTVIGDIKSDLVHLKNYFLMGKGEFYHVFIEESEQLFKFPPTRYANNDINSKVFQNSLIRLNWQDNQILNKIKYLIQNNGFDYDDFGTLFGLSAYGNVRQKVDAVRFLASKKGHSNGCLWHSLKQNIENGFDVNAKVVFRRATSSMSLTGSLPERLVIPKELEAERGEFVSANVISLVVQNLMEISGWKKKGATNLKDLPEYLCFKVGFLEQDITKTNSLTADKYYPFILIEHYSRSGNKGPHIAQSNLQHPQPQKPTQAQAPPESGGQNIRTVIACKLLDRIEVNFSEQNIHNIRVVYNRKTLSVFLWESTNSYQEDPDADRQDQGQNQGVPILEAKLNLNDYLTFDMGRANVGFVPDGFNSTFNIDLLAWSMRGFNVFNIEDPWNGLTLKYHCEWPNNLVLSDQILERYSNLFRLLFPIKNIQVQLHKAWIVLNGQTRQNPHERLFTYVSSLRNKMSFIIDNIWSYFHLDVLEVQWAKLEKSLGELTEFEDLRKCIRVYLEAIYCQTFLNLPEIVRKIFKIVDYCKKFCGLVGRMENDGQLIYDIDGDLLRLQQQFDENVGVFIRLINHLNQVDGSQYLSQLLTRLNFNYYYTSVSNEMELEY